MERRRQRNLNNFNPDVGDLFDLNESLGPTAQISPPEQAVKTKKSLRFADDPDVFNINRAKTRKEEGGIGGKLEFSGGEKGVARHNTKEVYTKSMTKESFGKRDDSLANSSLSKDLASLLQGGIE